jgi:hypothetical protein
VACDETRRFKPDHAGVDRPARRQLRRLPAPDAQAAGRELSWTTLTSQRSDGRREAIFLSTFVMISQNRADAKRQVLADQQWKTVQEEDRQNKQLLDLSEQILALTKEVREFAGTAQADHEQNEQLLELTKRTLASTLELRGAGDEAA